MSIEEALSLFDEDDTRAEFIDEIKTRLTSDDFLEILAYQITDCAIDSHEIMTFLLNSELREDLIEWVNDMGQFSWEPEEGL